MCLAVSDVVGSRAGGVTFSSSIVGAFSSTEELGLSCGIFKATGVSSLPDTRRWGSCDLGRMVTFGLVAVVGATGVTGSSFDIMPRN